MADFYLKIDRIDGESTAKGFEKWIELTSFSWGLSQGGAGGGGGGGSAGKVSVQDFHFVASTALQSPPLMCAAGTGEKFFKVVFAARRSGEVQAADFLKIQLSEVLVSSYQIGGTDGGEDVPSDQVSLSFRKIQMDVSQQGADGTPTNRTCTYDVKTNSKF